MSRPPSGATTPIRRSSPLRSAPAAAAPRTAAAPRATSPTTRGRVASNAPVVGARRSSSAQQPMTPRRGPDVVIKSSNRTTTPVGMVNTPRVATRRPGSNSPARRLSDAPPPAAAARNRPLSSSQKAITEKEHNEMMRRVTKIMSAERPLNSQHLFRITGSDEDLRLIHQDRCQRDPFIKGAAINCTRSRSANGSSQVGALITQSPGRSTPVRQPSPSRYPVPSTLKSGLVPSKVEPVTKRKSYTTTPGPAPPSPSSSRSGSVIRTASPVAPWTRNTDMRPCSRSHASSPTSRNATPERSGRTALSLNFDPKAPINPHRSRVTPKDTHHRVFRDEPTSSVARTRSGSLNTVVEEEPKRQSRVKTQAMIAQEVASQPPPELPPRKKLAIKRNVEAQYAHNIFDHQTKTSVLVESPRPSGVHISARSESAGRANPNQLVASGSTRAVAEDTKHGQRVINHRNNLTAVPLGNVATADPSPDLRTSHTTVKTFDKGYPNTSRLIAPDPKTTDPVADRKLRALQASPLRAQRHESVNMGAALGHQPASRTQSPVASQLLSKLQQSPMSQRRASSIANRSSAIHSCLSWD